MRFGFCAPAEHFDTLKALGYDYAEWPVWQALAPEKPQEDVLPPLLETIGAGPFRPETFYLFLPGDLKVVGEEVDPARQERYLRSAFGRMAALGGRVVGFGSGAARQIPEGFPAAAAREQFVGFLRLAGPIAQESGVVIAIEPLSANECNFLHSVAEGVEIAKDAGSPAVKVLSDFYHVWQQGQTLDETREAGAYLAHAHVAGSVGRRAPIADDIPHLAAFFAALKDAGYEGRVSVEGRWSDLAQDAAAALDTLREAWSRA